MSQAVEVNSSFGEWEGNIKLCGGQLINWAKLYIFVVVVKVRKGKGVFSHAHDQGAMGVQTWDH